MIRIIEDLSGDWLRLDERIQHLTEEIEVLAHGSESCRQLMTAPGIGPLIACAMVAAIGNGAAFAKGRDFAARLGAEADVDRRSDDPRAHHHARQSLATHAVNAGRRRYSAQACKLGKAPFWPTANGCGKTACITTCWLLPLLISWRGSPGPC